MNIRRYYVPNAMVFITQVVYRRDPVFGIPWVAELLLEILHNVQQIRPFYLVAYAILPDHMHLIIQPLPLATHSDIMHSTKSYFTHQYKKRAGITGPTRFWQKRYWDRVIRDEEEFRRYVDYVHYNPVKHSLVERPEDWPYSSFAEWRGRGFYPNRWRWSLPDSLSNLGDVPDG